jgi:hypothetical protein
VLLAALILGAYAQSAGSERRTSAGWALVEIFLFPGALILAFVRSWDPSTRQWALGVLLGTVGGALLVAFVTLVVDRP